MQPQRAILVNGSRLVRDLIKHVIEKELGIEVIREIENLQELDSAIPAVNADWVFVILTSDQKIPESSKVEIFLKHPTMLLIGLWEDGSQVRMEWLAREYRDFTDLTLDGLTSLLLDELRRREFILKEPKNEE